MNKNFSITFACYNALDYTKKCVESLIKHKTPMERLVIVDNASTDKTQEYLKSQIFTHVIFNKKNLGCGTAWNQGALSLQSEWTIIMNNDIIVSENWVENLISSAEENNLKVISPALIEGDLDYDFDAFAQKNSALMKDSIRRGYCHAVCLAIHESVWDKVGYFQSNAQLLGYEDTIFFNELRKNNIPSGMTGASWIHHYGSITLSEMKKERGLSQKHGLGNRKNYRLLRQSWPERKIRKTILVYQAIARRKKEIKEFGLSLHGNRRHKKWSWL